MRSSIRTARSAPVVAIVKSLASALAIGTGSAVGREGPIIQIGASLGSTVGQVIRMEPWQRITLVAAGAGIAATFNTPIGGVMFAIELMMPEVSVRTFLPVALSTGAATFIGRLFLGIQPAFTVLRHAAGMTVVGVMMYVFLRLSGHYHIEGVGYSTVQDVLMGGIVAAPFLAILFAGKLSATLFSLGSGSSGGIFFALALHGAMLGAAFGAVVRHWVPSPELAVPTFAMIGMAAMVGRAAPRQSSRHA